MRTTVGGEARVAHGAQADRQKPKSTSSVLSIPQTAEAEIFTKLFAQSVKLLQVYDFISVARSLLSWSAFLFGLVLIRLEEKLKHTIKAGLAAALLALGVSSASAAVIATYDLALHTGDNTLDVTSTSVGFTATAIAAVGTGFSGSFDNHFYFNGWGNSINPARYFSVTLSSITGSFYLDKMLFSVESTGPTQASAFVRTSNDGFASNLDSFTWGDPDATVTEGDFDFASLGAISGPLELRFYFTSAADNQLGFANHQLPGAGGGLGDVGRDISFEGRSIAVSAVPEPGSLALLGLGLAGLAVIRKRKQA